MRNKSSLSVPSRGSRRVHPDRPRAVESGGLEVDNVAQRIPLEDLVRELPEELKAEVYDFAAYLLTRQLQEEDRDWQSLSLQQAFRGLEQEEDLYTLDDLRVRWR